MDGSLEVRDRLLTRLVTFQKVQARIDAEVQDTLAELAALPVPAFLESPDKQYVVDEVAAVLRLPSRTAGARVATAQDLVGRFPATLDALSRGELTLDHARALSDEALGLDDATATHGGGAGARAGGREDAGPVPGLCPPCGGVVGHPPARGEAGPGRGAVRECRAPQRRDG
jgi:hypothetical protein